jgi:septal ring factor EnvC (AmiA/AmiB activator)
MSEEEMTMKRVQVRCAVVMMLWLAAMARPAAAQTPADADVLKQQLAEMDSRLERQRAELQALREMVARITPELASLQKSMFQQLDKLVPVGTVVM